MVKSNKNLRNAHFLGTKIRNLRKQNNLTMEDLSARCVKVDAESAPSISYLSMIERGKRVPREEMLDVIAEVFQKDRSFFLDDVASEEIIVPEKGNRGGIEGIALEPNFLFSTDILQIAIPEMLSQTGVTGRQFAHLLIRAHQENNQNHFPDLERAAESVGKKQMPLSLDDLMQICRDMNLKIKWFSKLNRDFSGELQSFSNLTVRSFFEAPNTIYINKLLKNEPTRLKYDLAVYIGHATLHDGDGVKSPLTIGPSQTSLRYSDNDPTHSSSIDSQDIVYAWRDFECSFFAGALLCPRVPFRRLLDKHQYELKISEVVDVSLSLTMRRMTAVSPYSHWHYFSAYPPGKLSAVYRGNGIPLPWGNMRMISDPCQHWAVFRMLGEQETASSAQISVLNVGGEPRIYCCESIKVGDLSGNEQVLCTGIDINPAMDAQGLNSSKLARRLQKACVDNGGSVMIPRSIQHDLTKVSRILNIGWLERGIHSPARVICPRSNDCPRQPDCRSAA